MFSWRNVLLILAAVAWPWSALAEPMSPPAEEDLVWTTPEEAPGVVELSQNEAINEDIPQDSPIYAEGGIFGAGVVVGLKVGGGFGQVTSPFGASFVGELELGYTLPLPEPVGRDFQLFLSGQYSGPSSSESSLTDPRLPGDGTWSYDVTLHQAILTFGVLYRIPVPLDWLRPYAAAGGRLSMSLAQVTGNSADMPFGDSEETATDFGGYGALGADFFVGPGAVLVELQFGYVPVDGTILENTNSGALNVGLGYRFFL